ncbi:CPBP family intramembrane glutamic endopeptidase [Wenyingzhuangia sp. IMCC45533]
MGNQYINQAAKGNTDVWRYMVGIVIIILISGLFSYPYSAKINSLVMSGNADGDRISDLNYLMTLMDANTTLFYMMLSFVGGLLAVYFVITKLHKLSWINFNTSRQKIDFKRVGFSFSLWGGISAVIILSGVLLNPQEVVLNFDSSKFLILLVIAVSMIPIQTSFEEYVFRGYLMQGLGLLSKTQWFPLVVTSISFGLMHLANPEIEKLGYGIMIFYIGTGLLLGVITIMDEGLELSLGFHAANNLITALLVTTDWTAFQTYAVFKDFGTPNLVLELVLIAILYPSLLWIFAKKYQWKNWGEKLL